MRASEHNEADGSTRKCKPPDAAAYIHRGQLYVWINNTLSEPEADEARSAILAAARRAGGHGCL